MKRKYLLFAVLALALLAVPPLPLHAQKYDATIYGGGFFPTTNDTVGRFRNEGLYGIRAGVFVTPNFELGANGSYINHFDLKGNNPLMMGLGGFGFTRPRVRAAIWEVTGNYNFNTEHFLFGPKVQPYLGIGVGGLTGIVRKIDNPAGVNSLQPVQGAIIKGTPADIAAGMPGGAVLYNGDTFFTVSYGGGIKAARLWGPVGIQLDARGRTMPNFYRNPLTWPEVSGGLNFSWGER